MIGKPGSVRLGFEDASLRLAISAITPLRELSDTVRLSAKYQQIAASIAAIGMVEPPVVTRDANDGARFFLLDGHVRLDVLKAQGLAEVVCLVARDDEAYTYNKHINRISIIQEHKMILNAIRKGVPEERLAQALNINIQQIRFRRDLLIGICPEAARLLQDRHVPVNVFAELRRLVPMRQIEVVQSMITMSRYALTYVKSLVASTDPEQFVAGQKRRSLRLGVRQMAVMRRESENLDAQVRLIEQTYGADQLDLVQAVGYVQRLLANARIIDHLQREHVGLLAQLEGACAVAEMV